VVPRRLLLWAVLGLVLVVGSALGRPAATAAAHAGDLPAPVTHAVAGEAADASSLLPASVAHAVGSAAADAGEHVAASGTVTVGPAGEHRPEAVGSAQAPARSATAEGDADGRPCVLRSECAGAWVFGAGGLLLAVAVAMPTIGAVTTVGRIGSFSQVMSSRLVAGRLFRPPQLS